MLVKRLVQMCTKRKINTRSCLIIRMKNRITNFASKPSHGGKVQKLRKNNNKSILHSQIN
jgi:hypothetical protein